MKLILKDPVAGVDIRGIGSGVAEINEDGTAKEVRLGSYPKPRGRVPLINLESLLNGALKRGCG